MKIANYNPSVNNAFGPDGLRNPKFFGAGFDYSFVGLAPNSGGFKKIVTAVGPNHVIAAKHYALNTGDSIIFINKDNKAVTVVVKESSFYDDVQVAVVDQAFADIGVSIAKLADYTNAAFKCKPTLNFGLEDSTGQHSVVAGYNSVQAIQAASSGKMALQSQRNGVSIDFGDSGAPDFVINGCLLELIGPHWSVSPTSYYTSLAISYPVKLS